MVFSKLALSCSRVACQPSSRVTSAHSSSTTRAVVEQGALDSEPERGSNPPAPDDRLSAPAGEVVEGIAALIVQT
jgi:hypothetical protein